MAGITGEEDTIAGASSDTVQMDVLSLHRTQPTLTPGEMIGRYVVLGSLGQGGMGVVVAAYDPELDRKVAIKLVRPEASSSSARDRMVREARSMAKLSHSNVVSVFDAGEHDGAIYIAMEFVAGGTLTEHMKASCEWRDVLALFLPAGRGLAAAHESGLVHRDFKPDNVMVGDDGRVRVMDFGLARREGASEPSQAATEAIEVSDSNVSAVLGDSIDPALTRAGALMGTPTYMAPEQFHGHVVDERADQFAFCVALYEGLYGERPFDGEGVWGLAAVVTSGHRRPVPRDRSVPRWLTHVLDRGLRTDPSDRWPSMAALLRAIERGRVRRRNRWIGLAIASPVALGLAGYGGHRAWAGQITEQCEAQARKEMPWPDRRSSLEDGVLATGRPFAARSYAEVVDVLDPWSESWVELRAGACRDERLDQTLEPDTLEAQVRCLEQNRYSIMAFADQLEMGNAQLLVFAVDNMTALSNLDMCRDTRALARRPRPAPEVQDVVRRANQRLNEMATLHLSGQIDQALELGTTALAELEPTGFTAGIADAKNRVGTLLAAIGRNDDARPLLEEAYFAAGAVGDDVQAADSARMLVGLGTGSSPYDIDWLRGWAAHAQMQYARLGQSDSLEAAEVLESVAFALDELGRPDTEREEIEQLQQARDIRASRLGDAHPNVLLTDINLATYATANQSRAPLDSIRDKVQALTEALGPTHPTTATVYLTLGTILTQRGRRSEALAAVERGRELLLALYGPDHPQLALAREAREEVMASTTP